MASDCIRAWPVWHSVRQKCARCAIDGDRLSKPRSHLVEGCAATQRPWTGITIKPSKAITANIAVVIVGRDHNAAETASDEDSYLFAAKSLAWAAVRRVEGLTTNGWMWMCINCYWVVCVSCWLLLGGVC